jgi:hypothetical protein
VILFYLEENGDYLAIDTSTRDHYHTTLGRDEYEGRAAAIAGQAGSVCTTGISRAYLAEKCKQVARGAVPAQWLRAIGLDSEEEARHWLVADALAGDLYAVPAAKPPSSPAPSNSHPPGPAESRGPSPAPYRAGQPGDSGASWADVLRGGSHEGDDMGIFDDLHRAMFDKLFSPDEEGREEKVRLLRRAGIPEEMIEKFCSPGIKAGMSLGGAKPVDVMSRVLFQQHADHVLLRVSRPPFDEAGHIEIALLEVGPPAERTENAGRPEQDEPAA